MSDNICSFCGVEGHPALIGPGMTICHRCARIAAVGMDGVGWIDADQIHAEAVLWWLLKQVRDYKNVAREWAALGLPRLAGDSDEAADTAMAAARVLASFRGWDVALGESGALVVQPRVDAKDWEELERLRKQSEGEES